MSSVQRWPNFNQCETPIWLFPLLLQVSIQLLQDVFKGGEGKILWSAVHHLVGGICYGGKVTDAQDGRALRALLAKNCSFDSTNEGYGEVKVRQLLLIMRLQCIMCVCVCVFLCPQAAAVSPGFNYAGLTKLVEKLPDEDTASALALSPVLQCMLVQNESKMLHSTLTLFEASTRSKRCAFFLLSLRKHALFSFPRIFFHSHEERGRDEVVLERAQGILEELPLGIKPFTLSTASAMKPLPASSLHYSRRGSSDFWSVLSPYWALLSNEVVALNEKILFLNTSLRGVVMEIKGEVLHDCLLPVYRSLAENMAPDSWKVKLIAIFHMSVFIAVYIIIVWKRFSFFAA